MSKIEKVETGIYRRGASYLVPVYAGKDPLTGKERRKWATARTIEEARKIRRRLQQEVEKAGHVPAQPMTFGDFLQQKFIPEHVAHLRPRTQKGYVDIVEDHLLDTLGKVRLDRLNRDHVAGYIASKRKEGLSERTLLHHYRLISKALKCAVEWGYLARNVAAQVPAPKPKKYEAQFLTPEQAQQVLDYLRALYHAPEGSQRNRLYPLVATALGTGCRISELLALKWEDVDVAAGRVYIRRALAQDDVKNGPVIGPTKNEHGRSIPLPEFVKAALWDRWAELAQEKSFYAQDYQDHGLVFCRPDGRPYDPREASRAWRKTLQKLNAEIQEQIERKGRRPVAGELLPHVRFHDLRHTCASFLLKQGVHPKIVQEILGHSRIEVTLNTYSHLLPGIAEKAAGALDKLLRTAPADASE